MTDPTDLADRDTWRGGFYELAIKLSADTLDASLKALWVAAELGTAYQRRPARVLRDGMRDLAAALRRRETKLDLVEVPVFVESVRRDQLLAVAEVPGLGRTAAGVLAEGEWLTLYLPLAALSALDPRVDGYPRDANADSRAWREPIEDWFAGIARQVFASTPFAHALTGYEVAGYEPDEVTGGRIGVLVPEDGVLVERKVEVW